MAKRNQLGYRDIESRLEELKHRQVAASDVGYHLLYAFGKSEKDISRYKEGKGVLKTFDGLLIKGLLCYKSAPTVSLTSTHERLKTDVQVVKAAPKIICVSDGETILAYDRREKDSYENPISRLYCDFSFFYPLADVERVHNVEESPADVKAAEKLAKLHDELRAYNEFSTDSDLHDLNIFISRLLFCFFAEDTGIFEPNLFSNSIKQYTKADGSDLSDYLHEAFHIMDVQEKYRGADVADIIRQFPYVNGGLFALDIQIPRMSMKARKIIIECGDLDWQDINPDIFGSMIQAVVNPDVRANQGMHYTSVPNIMKVINPLFLDELRGEYNVLSEQLKQKKQMHDVGALSEAQYLKECKPIEKSCNQLLLRMSKMKFFDPACGSGNFLIITYKMLRLLEMDILELIRQCHPRESTLQFIDGSCINIRQFYGIELLDFPHEIAMLSLWLAEHQMNKKLHDSFGVNTQALPLQNITQIKCGNACRLDWNVVCPHDKEDEVFVFGNPPYLGSSMQDASQKKDMEIVCGHFQNYKNLDYISAWFYKGSDYVKKTKGRYAFVSTNSICQGEQVALLWPNIIKDNLQIAFAYTSFKWANNAKYNAGVTCVIIGLWEEPTSKLLFNSDKCKNVHNINAYLMDAEDFYVLGARESISKLPVMDYGNKPVDGTFLRLTKEEKENLLRVYPESARLVRTFTGSEEAIKNIEKYCLWIYDSDLEFANTIPLINERIRKCREMRLASRDDGANKLASRAHQFRDMRESSESSLVIPRVSSESRRYLPIDFCNPNTIVSDSAFVIFNDALFSAGIISTNIHVIWLRAIGGKLETRYRYSNTLVYNTFPFPKISAAKKQEIEEAATDVLLAREDYPGWTLAELYDPDKMPPNLKAAHEHLDDVVESCYPGYPFASDEARLECLFKMYEKMTKK